MSFSTTSRKLDPFLAARMAAVLAVIAVSALFGPADLFAQDKPVLTAEESDPRKIGWMEGTPPADDKIIRFANGDYFNFPQLRWTVCHFRELMPTAGIKRGPGAPVRLPRRINNRIDSVTFTPLGSDKTMTWREAFDANYTDGIIVLHRGVVVYERYSGCLDAAGQHGAMSVTKSLTGLLGEVLVAEGVLDETARVDSIIPELANSAFGDATVRQVLDMTTGLQYSEDYANPNAEVWQHAAAGSPLPKPAGYTGPRSYWEYLQLVKKQGEHGEAFAYKTVNSDTLGWLIARKTGKTMAKVLEERIWSKMGAEQDGYITVDSAGVPFAGGGFNGGLRDMARIGQLMLGRGIINGRRVLPAAAVRSISNGGSKETFAKAGYSQLDGWSYRGMWWVTHNEHGAYMARGVHGQAIYVDPKAQMVIARFSSHPTAGNGANDPTSLPAYHAVAKYLMRR